MATEIHTPQKKPHNSDLKKRRYNLVAITIFIMGTFFSLGIWQFSQQAINQVESARFNHYSEMVRALVVERIDEHVAALRGLRAFMDSSEEVTRAEWRTYVNDLDIERHFKGALDFFFVRYVPRQDLPGFINESNSETPDFSVVSTGDKAELYIIDLIHPRERSHKLLGYDIAQDEALSKVFAESVSSGRAALSHATTLVKDSNGNSGVLLLMPVYKRAVKHSSDVHSWGDVRGWVGVSILVSDMVSGFNASLNLPIDIELLDLNQSPAPTVLYDADGQPHWDDRDLRDGAGGFSLSSKTTIDIVNRTWTLHVYALPGFSEKLTHNMPIILLCAGFLLSLLASLLVASYGKTLERAQQLATQMTKELRASEERFHKMFREHNAVMLLVNPETRKIVDANEAACKFYNYTREQIVSLSIDKINTLSAAEADDAMQQIKAKQRSRFEFRHILASGEARDVEIYSSPIIIDRQLLLFSIIHDVTERKIAEHELARYRENLESLVDEQTQKLETAHAKLLQEDRLAILGRVTATVSHELRNPLGTIKTALFSIEDSVERHDLDKALRPLELAERSIDRCVAIIEELNSFARVKSLNISEAVLDEWLEQLVAEQNIPAEINCELHLGSGAEVPFDQEKLRQVVVNIISNAVHALAEKGSEKKSLKISTRVMPDYYEISVADNGAGMSEETKNRLFEPLYSTKGFGVGLGMVVVKNIIEQHKGEISIDSQEGRGTTVNVHLPLAVLDK